MGHAGAVVTAVLEVDDLCYCYPGYNAPVLNGASLCLGLSDTAAHQRVKEAADLCGVTDLLPDHELYYYQQLQ